VPAQGKMCALHMFGIYKRVSPVTFVLSRPLLAVMGHHEVHGYVINSIIFFETNVWSLLPTAAQSDILVPAGSFANIVIHYLVSVKIQAFH